MIVFFKPIMRNCPKYRADITSGLIGIVKKLILNTYQEKTYNSWSNSININNFHSFLNKDNLIGLKSGDKYEIVESDKWGKIYVNLKLIREKYDRGLELNKLEKELVILTLTKVDEIEKIAKGDDELEEGCALKLKRLTNDSYTIGLYDKEEERRK